MFGIKKKTKTILTVEDTIKLQELERQAYMQEAEKLIVERGKKRANEDIGIKPKVKGTYEL